MPQICLLPPRSFINDQPIGVEFFSQHDGFAFARVEVTEMCIASVAGFADFKPDWRLGNPHSYGLRRTLPVEFLAYRRRDQHSAIKRR